MSWQRLSGFTLVCLLAIAPVSGRADDELTQFVNRTKLQAQKLTTDVNHALAQAKVLEKGDPEQAKKVLDRVLGQVRDSQDLPAADRTRLTQQLQARLRQLDETIRIHRVEAEQAAQRAGNTPRPRQPNSPAAGPGAIAEGFIGTGNAQLDAARKLRQDRDLGFAKAMGAVDSSSVATDRDVTFAKNWKELSEIRKATVGPRLTAKEVALLRTLNSTLSVDFKETSFKDVLEWLNDKTGLAIIVDQASLRDAMADYDESKITFKVNKVTVRTVLKKVLADIGLTYILQEGTVQVVTPQKARETMVVRTYPINDLVAPAPYAMWFGPYVANAQMIINAQNVINMIQNTIEPSMWNVNGGPGSITFSPQGMALVVRASAEMHYSIAGQMGR
jgi:hypothetical protein